MDLQDTLASCNWLLQKAVNVLQRESKASGSGSAPSTNAAKKFKAPKKKSVKRYEAKEDLAADGDSDSDEGEYNGSNVVYDSEDSEEEQVQFYCQNKLPFIAISLS